MRQVLHGVSERLPDPMPARAQARIRDLEARLRIAEQERDDAREALRNAMSPREAEQLKEQTRKAKAALHHERIRSTHWRTRALAPKEPAHSKAAPRKRTVGL